MPNADAESAEQRVQVTGLPDGTRYVLVVVDDSSTTVCAHVPPGQPDNVTDSLLIAAGGLVTCVD